MEQKTKKKSPRLAEKLKKAVQNLSVDVFGYESKVSTNIVNYFSKLSREIDLPQDKLIVRIFRDGLAINVAVYNQGRRVRQISVKELIVLFTNSEPSGVFNIETRVIRGIENFMVDFSKAHNISIDQLQICIVTNQDKVWIKAYRGIDFVQEIPLSSLIKHFIE